MVLQGLNNIPWYLTKGNTQNHQTKERGSGYRLWVFGRMYFIGAEYLGHHSDLLPKLNCPCGNLTHSHTPRTNTDKGQVVTGQLRLCRMSLPIKAKSVPRLSLRFRHSALLYVLWNWTPSRNNNCPPGFQYSIPRSWNTAHVLLKSSQLLPPKSDTIGLAQNVFFMGQLPTLSKLYQISSCHSCCPEASPHLCFTTCLLPSLTSREDPRPFWLLYPGSYTMRDIGRISS